MQYIQCLHSTIPSIPVFEVIPNFWPACGTRLRKSRFIGDWLILFLGIGKKKEIFFQKRWQGKKKKRQDGSSGSGLGSARSHRVELNRVEPVFHAACSTSDTIEYTTDQALFTFLFSIRRCHWYYGGGVIAKYISISTVTHLPTQLH